MEKKTNGFAVASLVLGIVSIVLCCCSYYIGIACAILAIVFAIIAKKQGKSGMATAGLVCGIVTAAISTIMLIITLAFASTLYSFLPPEFRQFASGDVMSLIDEIVKP